MLAPFDALNESERVARVLQLAARVERGEAVFHPAEKTLAPIQGLRVKIYEQRPRGLAQASYYERPGKRGPVLKGGLFYPKQNLKKALAAFLGVKDEKKASRGGSKDV